jgi:hypothetical protein
MNNNEYQCAACREIFEKGWSDEEAWKEKNELFPYVDNKDCCIICDDCFKKIFVQ